jgi:glycosyltransferase involved in cell wall biosynthesis
VKVFGISTVRNEADIIETNVRYHLSLGIDRVLVVDNGSADGTDDVLRALAEGDKRVSWTRDDSPFDQEAIVSGLAREAFRQGADWIVPFDTDEFWWAEGDFREVLARSEAGAIQASVVNFVQSRDVRDLRPESLFRMTYRAEEKPVGWGPEVRERMDAGELAYVEVAYPPKWISRPTEEILIRRGNHAVDGVRGPKARIDAILCLHAPLRSRAVLENKAEQGRRLEEAGVPPQSGWYLRRWSELEEQGKLDAEWAANSYLAGRLDLGRERRALVPDTRLRDALSPILRPKKPRQRGVRPLFVAGCQRSGTTAFTEYMNVHPEVLVLRERYKFVPHQVTPDLLTFDRILAYSAGETNVPEEQYRELLGRKDPKRLRWVGDKNPDYYAYFGRLVRQNPGARFVVLYRPLEEVAESFDARARDPEDHWPASFDFRRAVEVWNNALRQTRAFAEGDPAAEVLVLDYRDFFHRNETCVPLISRFLEIEFDEQVLSDWRRRSAAFEEGRHQKAELTEEQRSFLESRKDHEAEEWILKRIEDQREDPEVCLRPRPGQPPPPGAQTPTSSADAGAKDGSRKRILRLRRRVRHLSLENRRLKRQLAGMRNSKTWRLLDALNRYGGRLLRQLG